MIRSNASYHRYILDQVQIRLDNTNFNLQKDTVYDPAKSFDLIRAELRSLSDQGVIKPFDGLDKLTPMQYDQSVYNDMIDYLAREKKKITTAIIWESQRREDSISSHLKDDIGGVEAYLKLKADHYNKRLAELLTKDKQLIESAIEIDNRLVRKKDLIYLEPLSKFGRAHFYAPIKRIGELKIDTYLFNFLFIWLTTLVFYLTLVFDVLRRMVDWAERVKLRKK
jgi:hypothetical protein